MKFLDQTLVEEILSTAGNTIVQIVFLKRTNNEIRHLNGLLHVKAYVNGKGAAYDFKSKNLHTVFDLEIAKRLPEDQRAKAYRSFGLDSCISITANGKTHTA